MNWAIYLTTVGVIIAASGFLHQLLVKKKEATIETLTEKNKWLEKQLDLASNNSRDILTERLGKRILLLETELERLAKDYEANETVIKSKEEELSKTRELMAEAVKEIAKKAGEYEDLKGKVDVCPYCEAELVELKDVTEEDWVGSHRRYACGFEALDGDTTLLCPHDPAYPKFEQLKLETEYDETRKRWSCRISAMTLKIWRIPQAVVFGKTEREAKYVMQLCHEGRVEYSDDPPETAF